MIKIKPKNEGCRKVLFQRGLTMRLQIHTLKYLIPILEIKQMIREKVNKKLIEEYFEKKEKYLSKIILTA